MLMVQKNMFFQMGIQMVQLKSTDMRKLSVSASVFFFSPLSHTHILLLSLMKWRGQKKQRKKNSIAPITHPVLSLHTVVVVDCHVAIVTDTDPPQCQWQNFNPQPVSDTSSVLPVRHPVICTHPDRLLLLLFFFSSCLFCVLIVHSATHSRSTTALMGCTDW